MIHVNVEGTTPGLVTEFPDGRKVKLHRVTDKDTREQLWVVKLVDQEQDELSFAISHEALTALTHMFGKIYARDSGFKVQ